MPPEHKNLHRYRVMKIRVQGFVAMLKQLPCAERVPKSPNTPPINKSSSPANASLIVSVLEHVLLCVLTLKLVLLCTFFNAMASA